MARKKPTILIIEDDKDVAFLLRDVMESNGFLCFIEQDGQRILKGEMARPDLILLDIRLQGIDGYTICRRIKKKPETADIPVIFITALNTQEDVLEAREAGGMFFISKPFDIDFLIKKVKEILSGAFVSHQIAPIVRKVLYVNSMYFDGGMAGDPIRLCLTKSEFNVTIIEDPRDILRRAKIIHPDLIILNIEDKSLELTDLVDVLVRHRTTKLAKLVRVQNDFDARPITGFNAVIQIPSDCASILDTLRSLY